MSLQLIWINWPGILGVIAKGSESLLAKIKII